MQGGPCGNALHAASFEGEVIRRDGGLEGLHTEDDHDELLPQIKKYFEIMKRLFAILQSSDCNHLSLIGYKFSRYDSAQLTRFLTCFQSFCRPTVASQPFPPFLLQLTQTNILNFFACHDSSSELLSSRKTQAQISGIPFKSDIRLLMSGVFRDHLGHGKFGAVFRGMKPSTGHLRAIQGS